MNHLRLVAGILFGLLVIIVAVQNYQPFSTAVTFRIDLIFFHYETPAMTVYLVAVITFLIGLICSGLYGMIERYRLNKRIKVLMSAAKEKDKNIILGLETLGEFDRRMATIPSTDQTKIMQILVDRNKARWVEKDNNVLKIL